MIVSQLVLYYHILVLAGCIVLTSIAAINLIAFRRPRAPVIWDEELPFVSILVPARNEEANIGACVQTLLAQNYPHFEVVVLDDQSEDETYHILTRIRDRDERLRILVGAELPEGWCGKPHACWQLAHAARGSRILFIDADCRLAPDALLMAVGAAAEHDADLVSLMPEYVNVTFWERLIVPLLIAIPFLFLPIPLVRASRHPLMAAGNGSFLFMARETYLAIGGHKSVRAELAEDVKFVQMVKRAGRTEWYGDGRLAYRVRMYHSMPQIWQGFTRNLFPAFSSKGWLMLLVIAGVMTLLVLPLPLAVVGSLTGAKWAVYAWTSYGLMAALRIGIWIRLRQDGPFYALMNPLSWAMALAIAIGSMSKVRDRRVEWKGRRYGHGGSPADRTAR